MNTESKRHSFRNLIQSLPDYVRVCLISTFVWGLLSHGIALTNKFSLADDIHFLFSVGYTTVSGRWFLGVLGKLVSFLFGSPNFSLPLFGGLLTIFFTSLSSCVLVHWMDLKSKISWILVSGLLITYPVMSGLFFYNFTAPYYMFGLCLLFCGASILCRHRGIRPFLVGIVLMALSTSIYQAFIPLLLSLLLTFFIKEVLFSDSWDIRELIQEICWYCGACLAMLLLYLLSVKVSTALFQQDLLAYKGISSMGSASLVGYLQRIKLAIYLFFFPAKADRYAFIFPYRLLDCYRLTLVLLLLLGIINAYSAFRHNLIKGISVLLALAFFPLSTNFIYVACDPEDVYSLMQFSLLSPFLLACCLSDWRTLPTLRYGPLRTVVAVVLSIFCLFSVRMDNAVYAKANFAQTRTRSYFTTMVTQIKSTPGYTADTPVVYIGDISKFNDPTFQGLSGFSSLSMTPLPYDETPFGVICTAYDWQEYLNLWCGFNPPQADAADFSVLPEVQAMPSYPDSGSIRMINDILVIKLQK